MNARGHMLKCSHFHPAEEEEEEEYADPELHDNRDSVQSWGSRFRPRSKPFPCVVFCHGNAGSRVDALPLLPLLLPAGIRCECARLIAPERSRTCTLVDLGHVV